ncbi:hypothetical protein, conserved, partial [Eimeria tenella]
EAQSVAWALLRCRGPHRETAVQRLRELLLGQLRLLQLQHEGQQQPWQQQQQQQQEFWAAPSFREAASLVAALLRFGSLDALLLQQLWRGVCRGLAAADGGPGAPQLLLAAAIRAVAAGAPAGSVAVDARRLSQAAAATHLSDSGLWASLWAILQKLLHLPPARELSAFGCSLPPRGPPGEGTPGGPPGGPFGGPLGGPKRGPVASGLGVLSFRLSRWLAWDSAAEKDRFAAAQLLHLTAALPSAAAVCGDAPLLQAAAATARRRLLRSSCSSSSASSSSNRGSTSLELAEAQHITCCWVALSRLLLSLQQIHDVAAAAVYPQLSVEEARCLLDYRSSISSSISGSGSCSNSESSSSTSSCSAPSAFLSPQGVSALQCAVMPDTAAAAAASDAAALLEAAAAAAAAAA